MRRYDSATCVRFAGGFVSGAVDVLGIADDPAAEGCSSPLSSLGLFRFPAAIADVDEDSAMAPFRELGAVTAVDSEERRGAVKSVGESRGRAVTDSSDGGCGEDEFLRDWLEAADVAGIPVSDLTSAALAKPAGIVLVSPSLARRLFFISSCSALATWAGVKPSRCAAMW